MSDAAWCRTGLSCLESFSFLPFPGPDLQEQIFYTALCGAVLQSP